MFARRNMAWPKIIITPSGDQIPADDAQELRDLLAAFPGSKVAGAQASASQATGTQQAPQPEQAPSQEDVAVDPAKAAKDRWHARLSGQQAASAGQQQGQQQRRRGVGTSGTSRGRSTSRKSQAGVPITYNQAKTIGMSLGGMASSCPGAKDKQLSYQQLFMPHVDFATASEVLDAFEEAGVKKSIQGTPAPDPETAKKIFEEITGVALPLPCPI